MTRSTASSFDADEPTVLPGRSEELARLQRAIDGPGWCVLRGEAGSGKSSLLALALTQTRRDHVVARGVAVLQNQSFVPLNVVFPRLRGIAEPAAAARIVRDAL